MLDRLFGNRGRVSATGSHAASVEQGGVESGLGQARAAAARGDHETALSLWLPLAQAGQSEAQRAIAQCFLEGLGVEKSAELALKWLTLAADQGDAAGQRQLAEFHFKGADGFQSDAEAKRWYARAALQGDAVAQDMLSWMLAEDDAETNYGEAREWALKAARQGVTASMTRLGLFANHALGQERDTAAAATWWERAALRGDGDAQALLGAAHHLGAGRPRDCVVALAWLKRSRRNYSSFAGKFYEAVWSACTPEQRDEAERVSQQPLPAPPPVAEDWR